MLCGSSPTAKWTAGAPDDARARQWAFAHAAIWADDINMRSYGYTPDAASSATAGQNIGYADRNQDDYWHYKDVPFSPDGTPLLPSNPVDAVTQLRLMIEALPATSGASDGIRSYDLVWILHMIGDVHQPLHAVARVTRELPTGDRGANAEMVIPATGETITLHAYWVRVFGGYVSPFGALFEVEAQDGIGRLDANPELAKISDPERWIEESAAFAKTYAYAAPVSSGANAVPLTREYETNARNIARSQRHWRQRDWAICSMLRFNNGVSQEPWLGLDVKSAASYRQPATDQDASRGCTGRSRSG